MNKQVKSTVEDFIDSLSLQEKKEFDREYKTLLLEEMILAAMAQDNVSLRKLAKLAAKISKFFKFI